MKIKVIPNVLVIIALEKFNVNFSVRARSGDTIVNPKRIHACTINSLTIESDNHEWKGPSRYKRDYSSTNI